MSWDTSRSLNLAGRRCSTSSASFMNKPALSSQQIWSSGNGCLSLAPLVETAFRLPGSGCQKDNCASGSGNAPLFDHRDRQQLVPLRTEQKQPRSISRSANKANRRARYMRASRLLALPLKAWVTFKCQNRVSFKRSLTAGDMTAPKLQKRDINAKLPC